MVAKINTPFSITLFNQFSFNFILSQDYYMHIYFDIGE